MIFRRADKGIIIYSNLNIVFFLMSVTTSSLELTLVISYHQRYDKLHLLLFFQDSLF